MLVVENISKNIFKTHTTPTVATIEVV